MVLALICQLEEGLWNCPCRNLALFSFTDASISITSFIIYYDLFLNIMVCVENAIVFTNSRNYSKLYKMSCILMYL